MNIDKKIRYIGNASFINSLSLTFISQFIILVLGLILIRIFSVYLSENSYGIYMIIKRFIGIAFPILTINLSISLSRYISFDLNKKMEYLILSLLPLVILFLVLLLISLIFMEKISLILFASNKYVSLIIPMLIFLFANSFYVITTGYLRGKHDFVSMNILLIAFWIIQLLILLLMRPYYIDNWIFLKYYYLITSLIIVIVCFLFILFTLKEKSVIIKKMTQFNIINSIKNNLYFYKYGISRLPDGFFMAGIYFLPVFYTTHNISIKSAGYVGLIVTTIRMFQVIGNPFNKLFLPKFSKVLADGKKTLIKNYCEIIIEFIFTLPMLIGLIVYFTSQELVLLWLGNDFFVIIKYISLISPLIGILLGYIFIRSILNGLYSFPYTIYISLLGFLSVLVVLFVSYLFSLGILGAVISFGFGISLLGIASILILIKKQGLKLLSRNNLISILWVMIVFGIFYLFKNNIIINNILLSLSLKLFVSFIIVIISLLIYKNYKFLWVEELNIRLNRVKKIDNSIK